MASEEIEKEIRKLYFENKIDGIKIANQLNMPISTVYPIIRKFGPTRRADREKDMTGLKFNMLTVIGKSKNKKYTAIVQCECGTIKEVPNKNLYYKNNIISCGCIKKETGIKFRKWKPGEKTIQEYYKRYKGGAQSREYDFNISKKEFESLIFKNCNYCGISPCNKINAYISRTGLKIGNASADWIAQNYVLVNGVDRLDNDKGYTLDNTVSCCKICNQAKHTMTIKEFDTWIKRIFNFRFRE